MRASPRHDPNAGAVYIVTAWRDGDARHAERATLGAAKREALRLMSLDLDGDCYVEVEVWCNRGVHSARVYHHVRGESELRMRRALLALRRSKA